MYPIRISALCIIAPLLSFLPLATLQAQIPQPPPPAPPAPSSPVTIKSNVNVVLVPVLVLDAQGHGVANLTADDFQVFDRGKRQTITGFTIQKRALPLASTPLASSPSSPTNAPSQPLAPPDRYVVFLFDDMHLAAGDLMQVKKVASDMLSTSLAPSDMAAVTTISGLNSGLTRDRAKLQEAIAKLSMQNLYRQSGHGCPDVDYYHGDLIANKNDGQAFEVAVQDAISCAHLQPSMRMVAENMARSAADQAVTLGDQDVRVTLGFFKDLIRRMSKLPGQRTLVLVSPGFLTVTGEAQTLKSQIIDQAAQSNVTISALDARGLYTTNIDASESGSGPVMVLQQKSQYHADAMSANEDVMAELADGTAGTYFHNSNDLAGGFRQLAQAPEVLYLLEFSAANVKLDGSYHALKVKVARDSVKVRSRHGYYAPKPEKKKK
jgi:VWFA-related protein